VWGVFWFCLQCFSPLTLFSLSLSLFAPSLNPSPKDTSVSSVQPGSGLVLARQWAMQAFFPTVDFWVESLPSHAFSWACFTHTIDCRWCSGLSPADLKGKLDTSLSEEEPLESRQKQHTCRAVCPAAASVNKHSGHNHLGGLARKQNLTFIDFSGETENRCSTDKHSCFSCCVPWMATNAAHIPQLPHLSLLPAN